jgi:hypothetical protein
MTSAAKVTDYKRLRQDHSCTAGWKKRYYTLALYLKSMLGVNRNSDYGFAEFGISQQTVVGIRSFGGNIGQ